MQGLELLDVHAQGRDDPGWDLESLLAQEAPALGQRDGEGPVVVGVAVARHEAGALEAFEQRRQRRRLEADQVADLAHRQR